MVVVRLPLLSVELAASDGFQVVGENDAPLLNCTAAERFPAFDFCTNALVVTMNVVGFVMAIGAMP
jgi:hypothetical protein